MNSAVFIVARLAIGIAAASGDAPIIIAHRSASADGQEAIPTPGEVLALIAGAERPVGVYSKPSTRATLVQSDCRSRKSYFKRLPQPGWRIATIPLSCRASGWATSRHFDPDQSCGSSSW